MQHNNCKTAISLILLLSLIIAPLSFVLAANPTWLQTDWSGGLDGGTYPDATNNSSNWTKYSAVDADTVTSTALTISATSSSYTDTLFGGATLFQATTTGGMAN